MKKLILSLLTLAALVVGAQAQLVTLPSTVIYNSVTSNAVAGSLVIDVRGQQNVAIEWTQALNGAGSTVGGLSFVPSIDGTTIASSPENNGFSIVRAPNGTTPVVTITNFNVKGYNYLTLWYTTNGSAALQTNTIRYWVKPNAP